MRILKYHIVEAKSAEKLMEEVEGFIRMGWQPLGGVCMSDGSILLRYLQAVVLYSDG